MLESVPKKKKSKPSSDVPESHTSAESHTAESGSGAEFGSQSVEWHLFLALKKAKLIRDIPSARYSRCGRTDKGQYVFPLLFAFHWETGVSAACQVVSLNVRSTLTEGVGILPPFDRDCDQSFAADVTSAASASSSSSVLGGRSVCADESRELDYVAILNKMMPADIRVCLVLKVEKLD